MKKLLNLVLVFMMAISVLTASAEVIKGQIEEIAADASYIIVAGEKIAIDEEILSETMFQVGDKVEIEIKDGVIESYNYIYDDDN